MNFNRRQQSSNRRENDNIWTDRSDNRSGDNFGNRIRDFNSGSDNRMMSNFNEFDNERHNRNFGRRADQKRENFDDSLYQRRDKNIGSGFPVRENSFDNPIRSRDQKYGNDFQKRENFNDFTDQGREKKFGSDFPMRDNSSDYVNRSHDRKFENDYQSSDQGRGINFGRDSRMRDNDFGQRRYGNDIVNDGMRAIYEDYGNVGRNNEFGNDNRMRGSFRDFQNTGRDNILRSDDRIHDFSSHGRINDLGSNNDRTRESVNFRNQGSSNNFLNSSFMPRNFNEIGYDNRDNNFGSIQIPGAQIPNKQVDLYQRREDNTFLKPDSIASTVGSNIRQNKNSNKTRGNDGMFRNFSQGTKIQNIKRSNDPKLQDGPKDLVFSKLSNQPTRKVKKEQTPKKTSQQQSQQEGPKGFVFSKSSNPPIRNKKKKSSRRRQMPRRAWLTFMEEQSIIREQKEADKNNPEIKHETTESDVVRTTPSKNNDKKKEKWRTFSDKIVSSPKYLSVFVKDYGVKGKQIPNQKQALFEKVLRDKIENEKPGVPRPIFTFAGFVDGYYRITCADDCTYAWVRANIPFLKLWNGAKMKIIVDMMKKIHAIPASPKQSLDFDPISEKDLIADLVDRNNCRGEIDMPKELKIKHAISVLITRGSHLPYNFTRTARGSLSVECKDLTSLQWLYDHLSVLDRLWPNADLRLIQRRTLLYFRKITFTLKQNVTTLIEVLTLLVHDNDTLHTGLWMPLQLHPDGRTLSFAIEEQSVKDLEALGSRIKYSGDTIDVQIHPRDESQAKGNIDSLSVIQEIDNYELKQTSIAGLSGAEENASAAADDN